MHASNEKVTNIRHYWNKIKKLYIVISYKKSIFMLYEVQLLLVNSPSVIPVNPLS